MQEKAKDFIANTLGKLNEYTILQVLWIIEIYYLSANSISRLLMLSDDIIIPNNILEYNNHILKLFHLYNGTVLYMAIVFICCGLAFVLIKGIDILTRYELIYRYCTYGISLGIWLLLMYCSYYVYKILGPAFLLSTLFVYVLSEVFKLVRRNIRKALGFTDYEV
ncbi:hypothetical protein [Anaerocolumna xylanovorans]|uniref:Uncharacterized protein n=1 Tax=Anaerocolumna xylanovorans DSM 12503 TaxID=1121345 RepID=A0A1M7YLI1_9FIRM|nr:hypothetical protein [Anaerocolumna xylanovorans]SHO53456.1 hypothetical protein SAMN02745217_04134 [Anaerocolumna xylanovorans DSM 12503]